MGFWSAERCLTGPELGGLGGLELFLSTVQLRASVYRIHRLVIGPRA